MRSAKANEVWVAEDNQDVRLILTRAFKRTHPATPLRFFEHGGELVTHFEVHRVLPNLLLLDLQMPVMSGLEALRALRSAGCCGSAPIVIFSSMENPETIRAAYFAGAKLFLKKPHNLEEYSDVATLCATSADAIQALLASAIPFGALDVKRVLKLLADNGENQ